MAHNILTRQYVTLATSRKTVLTMFLGASRRNRGGTGWCGTSAPTRGVADARRVTYYSVSISLSDSVHALLGRPSENAPVGTGSVERAIEWRRAGLRLIWDTGLVAG
jgi:hypothetical protein